MDGLLEDAGSYRYKDVMITGAKHQPPSESKLPNLMSGFYEELETSLAEERYHPVQIATWVHWTIARIHPFSDVNGRMARLWQDLILFGHHLTASIIPQHLSEDYYKALTAADDGNFNPLARMIASSLSDGLNIYLGALREADEVKDWASELLGESRARSEQKLQLEYLQWCRKMKALKDAFQRCASQITGQSDGTIEIQLKDFDILNGSTWELLRSGTPAGMTWYFWLHFRKEQKRLDYCFFFGRHLTSELDETLSRLHPSPCLLISEEQDDEHAVRLNEFPSHPISLRELIVIDGRLVRKRVDRTADHAGQLIYDEDIDPLQVAREFIHEVLLLQFKD